MNEDDIIKDEDPHEVDEVADLDTLDAEGKKKKEMLDEDTESLDDLADDELEIDKEDLMDDVNEI